MLTARQIITKEYGYSKNFMTPIVISTGMASKNVAYEISTGEGFDREPIWGVSFVKYNPETDTTERDSDRSDLYHSLKEAQLAVED